MRIDRLTTLMNRFHLTVRLADLDRATLVATTDADGQPLKVMLGKIPADTNPETVLFSAIADWGGASNPLVAALPDLIEWDLRKDPETAALITLMQAELQAQRCGVESVVNRLGEVLIVRMLRTQIEAGSARPGVLAGLSDPRLSRAIVAIHDRPGHLWRNEDLAQIAGLSLSRFAETFLATVGEPPAAYLGRWRLTLARQDLEKGDRVDAIARRYGYSSPDGFARAFRKHFGTTPITLRPSQVA